MNDKELFDLLQEMKVMLSVISTNKEIDEKSIEKLKQQLNDLTVTSDKYLLQYKILKIRIMFFNIITLGIYEKKNKRNIDMCDKILDELLENNEEEYNNLEKEISRLESDILKNNNQIDFYTKNIKQMDLYFSLNTKKSDYIKILRGLQNDLKTDCLFFDNSKPIRDNYYSDIKELKRECIINMLITAINGILCVCNDKYILGLLFCLLSMLSLKNYNMYDKDKKISDKEFNIYKWFITDYQNQIKKLDNAIEFFQNTSEEEVQKYLSYKMGDSKKIN